MSPAISNIYMKELKTRLSMIVWRHTVGVTCFNQISRHYKAIVIKMCAIGSGKDRSIGKHRALNKRIKSLLGTFTYTREGIKNQRGKVVTS